MELSMNFEQLQLKSEYLHTNSKHIHFHEDGKNTLLVSWDDCVMVLYSLNNLSEASLWNPIEPIIVPISNPIISILTFNSKMYCIDKVGSIYHLKQVQRDSPDLFDCSQSKITEQPLSCNYEWKPFYSQKCPCEVFGTTCYTDGIALIIAVGEWIMIQMLKITINENNEPTIFNACNKQIRSQKSFPFVVTSFVSCTWRDWFSSKRAMELFGLNVIDCVDIFIIATEESKVYCTTSNVISKKVSLFLNSPQQILHIQFLDFDSKKLLLVSSNGICMVVHCVENVDSTFIYLAVTKTVATFIVDHTVILSDGVNLFFISLDKQFSKIVKQTVTQLKGVISLCRFQSNNIIAITRLNKVYKLSSKLEVITKEEELKFKFNEKSILKNIKILCENIESLKEQHDNMNKYINAVSIVARKDLVAQHCSLNILIYSGAKAVKLGACQDEYIFAIKLSTDCSWLSFPSSIWQLLVRITDDNNLSSNCGLHSFDVDLFNNNHPLIVKHKLLATVAENYTSGLVHCELVCQVQNDSINRCLIIPLNPIKLNSLYFVKAEKREKILLINPLEDRHKYVFKFPENVSLADCLTVITNRNKHRTSKSFYKNIIDNTPNTLYLNYFGKIVSIILDNKITNTITLECLDQDSLVAVRNGVFSELSNDQSAIINISVLADIQKELCLLEELSVKDRQNKNIFKEIKTKVQNQISNHLPV
ncbi:Uncharacterized protein FWK35_00018072 [Aphis craccivora]|uniref:Uncharacterized protein n=1 Tax=Aphis craccivora TaxID=307492 RepID=A0A6G0YC96_APHCR|nr:Uncharacterized protein FWK35_00018072 [Aphis craccivora]